MKVLLVFLLTVSVIIFLVNLILYTLSYFEGRWDPSSAVTMKFPTWIKMYVICPKNWDIKWDGPCISYKNWNGEHVYKQNVNISFLTYWRYILWKRMREKREANRKQALMMQELLSYMQDDINRLAKESQKQIDKASKESAKYIKALVEEDGTN